MQKIYRYIQAYHPIVHVLMLGTVFISFTSSMSMPFLAIFLGETTPLDYATIGFIIGAGPLAGTLGSFIGGILSDFLGRTRLIVLSLLILSISFLGFIYTKNPFILLFISILRGLAASFFNTISKALTGDLTPETKRVRAFSNRYLANNLGYSLGPIFGALLGISGGSIAFFLTTAVYIVYALLLFILFRAYNLQLATESNEEKISVSQVLRTIRSDAALFLFILGGVLLMTVYGQISISLSQYLKSYLTDGIQLFSILMSLNASTVLLLQIPLTRWSERFSLFFRIALGSILLTVGLVGFAFSSNWFGFILSMIIFTLGEILVIPAEYAQIDEITPKGMRGTYYGAQGFTEFGNFIGPWMGGIILAKFGGPTLFLTLAMISLSSIIFFFKGRKLYMSQTSNMKSPSI
ncbi:MDR family MFS transporter [Thermoflavimicrobium daqui]|uniref:MFS transporter n=1 Tax=Thermoflavimicrobium daqui TaxID=2137476 RepID=A0A364K4H5_9BACL|nr:MFS transporter [Thermoflavimicrobium daqui]RAL24270.1 MFS transporter [Thermoflavimicrobium daqui]